jgi:predicted nucleic acid-binding protein
MAADPLIIIDTGPIVALLDRRDAYHKWAIAAANSLSYPYITSESVISETLFLLQENNAAKEAVFEMLEISAIRLAFDPEAHIRRLTALMRRYADQPMSLADASLVQLSEIHANVRVFTTDRHFKIYRRNERQLIPLIAPWSDSDN